MSADFQRQKKPTMSFERFPPEAINQSISDRFEQQVELFGEHVAVQCGDVKLSYSKLNQVANRWAGVIRDRCGDDATPVPVLIPQGAAVVVGIMAVLKAGRCYVPLDPTFPLQWIQQVFGEVDPQVVIADSKGLALAGSVVPDSCQTVNLDEPCEGLVGDNLGLGTSPDAAAYIYYTSGSTGLPKGVIDSQRNVLHNIMRYTNSLQICPHDRLTLVQSPSFSGAVSSMFGALLNGATSLPFDLRTQDEKRLAHWLNEEQATIYHSVPSIFRRIATDDCRFPYLRLVRLEGDKMALGDLSRFRKYCGPKCRLVNGLGATECGIVRQFFIDDQTQLNGLTVPIGYEVEDMEVLVLNEQGISVGPDVVGEIVVRSRYLAQGYWRRPELTAAAFTRDESDPDLRQYHTGDMGRMQWDGCLEHLGRKDNRVKIQGLWVDLATVESELSRSELVQDAAVIAATDAEGISQLVGFYVPASTPSVSEVKKHLARRLPWHMVPAQVIALDQLPTTKQGKLDRSALAKLGSVPTPTAASDVGPRTPLQQQLWDIWTEVLALEQLDLNDDFLQLGGDSLAANRIIYEITIRTGIEITFVNLFEYRSISSLADYIEQVLAGSEPIFASQPPKK